MPAGPFELDPSLSDSAPDAMRGFETHEVFNQTPPVVGRNLFDTDPVVLGALEAALDPDIEEMLQRAGAYWGSAEAQEIARLANTAPPVLRTHDRFGYRLDSVEFHPAYHALMRHSVDAGLHAALWESDPALAGRRNAVRAAGYYLAAQGEAGHLGALTATSAAVVALAADSGVVDAWLPGILSRRYDHRSLPAAQKLGLTIGIGLTEKQGGTDARTTTTIAEPAGEGLWQLTGHKWFLSAPMSDAFVVLAQAEGRLGCFLVPRVLDDGGPNAVRFQRLKDKLGTRSNATAEAELAGAYGFALGEPGHGLGAVLQMVTLTRFDSAVASAGLMRAALTEAVHHARHRVAFGATLIDQPIMTRVLADLALDSAAASALVMRLALAFDAATTDAAEAAYVQLMTPVAKYWVSKIAPGLIAEAMECIGGNGYVEESVLPRLYRDAPALTISDGPGNAMCLDVLRTLRRDPAALDAVLEEIGRDMETEGPSSVVDIRSTAAMAVGDLGATRVLTEQLALAAAASALRRCAPRVLSDAFMETRIAGPWRATYGKLDGRFDARGIVDYVVPDA